MNWLDIVLIVLMSASILGGFAKGLVRTALGFTAAIAGLVCGLWFYRPLGMYVRDVVSSRPAANLLAFLLIFFAIVLAGALLGKLLAGAFKLAHLSWLDRALGGAFGLVRGVLVAAGFVLVLMAFASKYPPDSVTESRVAPYVIDGARAMAAAAPQEVKEGFRRSYDRVKEIWADAMKKGIRPLPKQVI